MSTINTQGFGIQLAPAGFSLEANKVFATLALAQEFIQTKPAAYVGSVISVTNDTAENNGIYWVESIGEGASLRPANDIDLSNYYTKEEVDGLIPEVPSIYLNGVEQEVVDGKIDLKFEIPAPEDVDLSGYYTKEETDAAIQTAIDDIQIPSLEGYATEDWVKEQNYLTEHQDLSAYAKKDELFSGSYNDLTDKPEIPSLEGYATEDWVEGKGYLTEHQDLSEYAKTQDIPVKGLAEDDATLTLNENGVLSSEVSFDKETIGEEEFLVVRGKGGKELGKVATAEFTADSFLNDVYIEENLIKFVWKMADDSTKTDSVNLEDYIKPYEGDGTTISIEGTKISINETLVSLINNALQSEDLTGYATEEWVSNQGYALKTELFSKSYNDLTDTPTIPSIEGLAKESDLAAVAKTGSYNDLVDVPTDLVKTTDLEPYAKTEDLVDSYSKEESDAKYALAGSGELNVIEKIQVKEDSTTTKVLEVGDGKTVTIDLSGLDSRLDTLEGLVVGGEGEGLSAILGDVEKLKTEKQDKLSDGSAEKPHLIWVSETNEEGVTTGAWTPGKIEIPVTPEVRLVPETTGVESPAILAWDGTNIVWSSSEVQKELPEYSVDNAGQILTVNTEGSIVWQTAPVSTTVTKDVITEGQTQTYTITQDENSVAVYDAKDVYTKTEVDSMFTWQTL